LYIRPYNRAQRSKNTAGYLLKKARPAKSPTKSQRKREFFSKAKNKAITERDQKKTKGASVVIRREFMPKPIVSWGRVEAISAVLLSKIFLTKRYVRMERRKESKMGVILTASSETPRSCLVKKFK